MTEQLTTRQIIAEFLRKREYATPSMVADHVNIKRKGGFPMRPDDAITEILEVGDSLGPDEQLFVTAPKCKSRRCGYDGFDNRANIPSKCPKCNGTWIEEPDFTIVDIE